MTLLSGTMLSIYILELFWKKCRETIAILLSLLHKTIVHVMEN